MKDSHIPYGDGRQEKVGPSEVSPRLQHMVETLKELKNNKLGGSAQKHQGMVRRRHGLGHVLP